MLSKRDLLKIIGGIAAYEAVAIPVFWEAFVDREVPVNEPIEWDQARKCLKDSDQEKVEEELSESGLEPGDATYELTPEREGDGEYHLNVYLNGEREFYFDNLNPYCETREGPFGWI